MLCTHVLIDYLSLVAWLYILSICTLYVVLQVNTFHENAFYQVSAHAILNTQSVLVKLFSKH